MKIKKDPEISIIIPLYNTEKYITKCLHSIKKQVFSSYELIIIDDCSTDNSANIVNDFRTENSNIDCIFVQNSKNEGASYARNLGLQMARGKYICFVDSDDILHPEFLLLLHHQIQLEKSDITFCGYNRCYDSKIIPYEKTWKYPKSKSIFKLKLNYILGKTHICHCTILYRRSFLSKINLQYHPNCFNAADTEFVTKMLFNNPHFSCVQSSLYYYVIHENSISTSVPSSKNFDGYFAYKRACEYIKNPLWKILFILNRESREIMHIVEKFYKCNMELPYYFCSKYKILFMLIVNMLIYKSKRSYMLLKYFCCTQFKKE